jgi:hypothetical protein
MKKQILISAALMFVFCRLCIAANAAQEVTGSVSEVIVYRGQALVTRTIELDLPQGGSELIVRKLPNKIVPESLYAQASGDATVSSVRYRERAVEEDTRKEVKKLDVEIEKLQTNLRHAEMNLRLIHENRGSISKLQNLTISAAQSDLDRGLLQYDPLEKLFGHVETKRAEYHKKQLELDDEILALKKQLELLQRKRNELRAGRSRSEREVVLFVSSSAAGEAAIQLRYLVNDAGWLPQYNLRAEPDKSAVSIEYNAVIHQASGEDWTNVAMSLSTAQPTMEAGAPELEPMEVKLTSGAEPGVGRRWFEKLRGVGVQYSVGVAEEAEEPVYRDLSDEFQQLERSRRQMARKGRLAQSTLNTMAEGRQMMELQADKEAVQKIQSAEKEFARTEGVSVTYDLPGALSMPSRSDQQLLTIAAFSAKAKFLHIATPLLTDYVYLQADITNNSKTIMLAGPASMYLNGGFVGKANIELVTIGEEFTTGFGVDSQVRISREFKDKEVDTLWGNRVEEYDYRIAIDNYKNRSVKLRLLERIPYTEDEDLEIENFKTNRPLSTDAEYVRSQKEKGILRWDLNLKSVTTGQKATVVTYHYTMKYDNDMSIGSVPTGR